MKTRTIVLTGLILIASGCTNDLYMKKLVPNSTQTGAGNPYGAYVKLESTTSMFSGELIAYAEDTLYLLAQDDLKRIPTDQIQNMQLILARHRAGPYMTYTLISMVPNLFGALAHSGEYGGNFLALAAVVALPGVISASIESDRDPYTIKFPDDDPSIESFAKFARFPAGLPPGLDLQEISN